ncbi:MAG: Holliday junction branch migration protein RuvA [Xenococcaceae cyanobacterium MO_188.B32]|nr:Holliday junction branch migration protein RuvA [Xenococcaceae cyanobacterium MO_188.B32]
MISYLKGKVIEITKNTTNRIILIIEVNQIGYEVQIASRLARKLSVEIEETVQIFTDQQIREDRQILYGFASVAERDLFRQLIGVSGIGTQSAIALIDSLGINDLVGAIVNNNIPTLTKTPGIGKKTAERLVLELKTKLAHWKEVAGVQISTSNTYVIPRTEIIEDLEMTLLALGYTQEEIEQAISAISQDNQLLKNPNVEEWIRSAISWLSGD